MRSGVIGAFLFVLWSIPVFAIPNGGNVFTLTSEKNQFSNRLNKHLFIYEDSTHALDVESVRNRTNWVPYHEQESFNTASTYWGKLSIANTLNRDTYWALIIHPYLRISEIEVHIFTNNEHRVKKSGKLVPLSELDLRRERFNRVNLFLPENEAAEVYIKVTNRNHRPIDFQLQLIQRIEWAKKIQTDNIIQAIFHGILWIMIFYNLFMYLTVKDRAYLFYVLYMFMLSVYALYYKGYLKTYLTGNMPELNEYIWVISAYSPSIFYFLFARHYFLIRARFPRADKAIMISVKAKIIALVILLVVLVFTFNTQLVGDMGSYIMLAEIGVYIFYLSHVIITSRRIRNRNAIYFVVGTSVLILSAIIFIIRSLTAGENVYLILQVGILIELLCFSYGLADRMKQRETKIRDSQKRLIEEYQKNQQLQVEINQQLEAKVRERTAQIEQQNTAIQQANGEITRKNKELIVLNEEKNNLMGIVAHDLGSPLANVKLMTQLIQQSDSNLTQKQQELLGYVIESSESMMQMINKVLDINAAETRQLKLEKKEITISSVLQQSVESFSLMADDKGISLTTHYEDTGVKIVTDPFYARQIFDNLLSNAIKYSPEQSEVTIQTRLIHDEVTVTFIDQGPGIREEDLPFLFTRYYTTENRPTNGEKSFGLGLSIVKRYSELLDASIACENNPDSGITFTVIFPVNTPVNQTIGQP